MGNCQAIDAAALVIQHPDGKIERLYWPVTASEVMRMNPGHYVSLIIPLPPAPEEDHKSVRFTRVKLLRPTDTLSLGHAYRLVTSQGIHSYSHIIIFSFLCFQQEYDFKLIVFFFFFWDCRGYECLEGQKICKDKEAATGIS